MSAPIPGSAGSSPGAGFYPDPSIPGYIRYWSGTAWVPGTSRPAPADGEPLPAPPPGLPVPPPAVPQGPTPPARQGPGPSTPRRTGAASSNETGPVFLDEEPVAGAVDGVREERDPWDAGSGRAAGRAGGNGYGDGYGDGYERGYGGGAVSGAPAASPSGVSGVSGAPGASGVPGGWGGDGPVAERSVPGGRDPRLPDAAGPRGGQGTVDLGGRSAPATPQGGGEAWHREPDATPRPVTARPLPQQAQDPVRGRPPAAAGQQGQAQAQAHGQAQGVPGQSPYGGWTPQPQHSQQPQQSQQPLHQPQPQPAPQRQSQPQQPHQPQQAAHQAPPQRQPHPQSPPQAQPQAQSLPVQQSAAAAPHPASARQAAPATPQPAPAPQPASAAQPLPAQQQAAAAPQAAAPAPWKPPTENPFLLAARQEGRPAGLGRRLAARLIDTVVLGGAVAAVAVPLWARAVSHIDEKVDRAKRSGETVTVWLLDGTTGTYLAIVLAALLLGGVLYEVLPTATWGRTPGKKLCGVRVLDIESHDTPSFAAALRRWLVYSLLGVVAVGVLNAVWCLFDRPWRQCWHDKAARTFVASGRG
ncbi:MULTISPECIES: RDD family protein [Streptomyces]|uniref:RDD family protein n=1 Tax=Streptomyces TaxID=1883 RepID=UPI00163D05DC|nr:MULTISPECIES: RDD family protein [Streptomyces]MBC2877734.1 RDD family protein [Streptomyces sp. TYQ1024]UBI38640.1 RDD family protein [Streptomyces mobaraensis]UKW31221.1 RDD family protein [Streptomyces sp. TYQ1024]